MMRLRRENCYSMIHFSFVGHRNRLVINSEIVVLISADCIGSRLRSGGCIKIICEQDGEGCDGSWEEDVVIATQYWHSPYFSIQPAYREVFERGLKIANGRMRSWIGTRRRSVWPYRSHLP